MDASLLTSRFKPIARSAFPGFAIVYASLFAGFGLESPFLPAFFAERGLTAESIGLVLAGGTLVRLIVTPLFGRAADALVATRAILGLTAAAAGLVGLGYLPASGVWPILAVVLVHSIVLAPLNPLADALALAAAAREHVFEYGWVRGVGSGAFIIGTLVSGEFVFAFGLPSIIVTSSLLFLVLAATTLALPAVGPARVAPGASPGSWSSHGWRVLLAEPVFRRLLIVAALVMGSHAMSDTFAVISWQKIGIGPRVVSLLWSEAVVAEILTFLFLGPWLLHRLGPARCLALSAFAGIVRWGLFATATSSVVLAGAQCLHGLTFALLHLACMGLIAASVPTGLLATAQALYAAFSLGVVSAVLTAASGRLYVAVGTRGFWLMAALCLVAVPLALTLREPEATGAAR